MKAKLILLFSLVQSLAVFAQAEDLMMGSYVEVRVIQSWSPLVFPTDFQHMQSMIANYPPAGPMTIYSAIRVGRDGLTHFTVSFDSVEYMTTDYTASLREFAFTDGVLYSAYSSSSSYEDVNRLQLQYGEIAFRNDSADGSVYRVYAPVPESIMYLQLDYFSLLNNQ